MNPRPPLCMFLLLGSAATVAAAAQLPQAHTDTRPESFTIGADVGLRPVARDGLRATAPGYEAEFDRSGLWFSAVVPGSDDRPSLRYTALSVGRSGPVHERTAAPPSAEGQTVRFDHGTFAESYDLDAGHLDLSFTFRELPPGHGDLVVHGRIDTDLESSAEGITADGLVLTGADGGISIGSVTGIDANGVTARGSMRYADGTFELILPAHFVDRAALPLVLDPRIGGIITVAGSYDQERPDAAYDADLDLYLVVFERRANGKQHVYGQLIRPDGSSVNAPFLIQSAVTSAVLGLADPRVASLRGKWLCVWHDVDRLDIYCATIYLDPTTSAPIVSSALGVAATSTPERFPAVGGGSAAIVTWSTDTSVLSARVDARGPGVIPQLARVGTVSVSRGGRSSVSRDGGTSDRWFVASEFTIVGDTSIVGRVLDRNLAVLNRVLVSNPTGTFDNDNPSVDGDGTNWLVAYESEASAGSGDNGIVCVRVHHSLGILSYAVLENTPNVDEREPAVAWCGGSALVSFVEARTDTPTENMDVFVRSVDPLSCRACEGKFSIDVSQQYATKSSSIASQGTGGGGGEQALVVWERDLYPGGTTGVVRAQRFRADHGTVEVVSTCQGQAFAQCARQGNALFEHRLRYAASPQSMATLLMSLDRIDAQCGQCVLVPSPFTGLLFPPVAVDPNTNMTTVQMPIPPSSALTGLRFYAQWLISPSLYQRSCTPFGIDLSNAIEVTLD